jgi:membrane protease YdiL (CAAX protease family)
LSFKGAFRIIRRMQPPPLPREHRQALVAHVAPFLAWLVIMTLPFQSAPWRYALQTAVGAFLLLTLRPWRFYPRASLRHLPLAAAVGAGVCLVWIGPELPWITHYPYLNDLYLRYGIRPLGVITGTDITHPFAPEICGWPLSLIRLAGSSLVIAAAEEYFWRGFLYRWLINHAFLNVPERPVHVGFFLLTALLFGLEHDRWLVGIVAGLAYGALYLRTRDITAAVAAHMVTNFLLGLYVLAFAAYHFW